MRKKIPFSKKQLEIELSKLHIFETPRLKLEQYPVSSEVASELLYMAGFENSDLHGRIIDLGTGTGRLAIGAVLMGAKDVTGIDVDEKTLEIAAQNASMTKTSVNWILSDVENATGVFDTVLMNPPYGTRTKNADRKFLEKAFDLAPTIYSIHKSSTRNFVIDFVKQHERQVIQVRKMKLKIPHLFHFHNRKWADVDVDLFRITR
jgi:putative methylase